MRWWDDSTRRGMRFAEGCAMCADVALDERTRLIRMLGDYGAVQADLVGEDTTPP